MATTSESGACLRIRFRKKPKCAAPNALCEWDASSAPFQLRSSATKLKQATKVWALVGPFASRSKPLHVSIGHLLINGDLIIVWKNVLQNLTYMAMEPALRLRVR